MNASPMLIITRYSCILSENNILRNICTITTKNTHGDYTDSFSLITHANHTTSCF